MSGIRWVRADTKLLTTTIANNPSITLKELSIKLNKEPSAVCKKLGRLGYKKVWSK